MKNSHKATLMKVGIGRDKQKQVNVKLRIFSYPSVLLSVLGAQKNRLIETVLLSSHNICLVEK